MVWNFRLFAVAACIVHCVYSYIENALSPEKWSLFSLRKDSQHGHMLNTLRRDYCLIIVSFPLQLESSQETSTHRKKNRHATHLLFLCSVVFRYTSVSKHQQIIKALHCCCCCWYQESGRLTTKIVSFFLLSLPFTQFWLVGFPPTAPPPPPPVLHAALPRVDLPLWELGLGELDWWGGVAGGEERTKLSLYWLSSAQSSRLLSATVLGNRNFARTCRRLPFTRCGKEKRLFSSVEWWGGGLGNDGAIEKTNERLLLSRVLVTALLPLLLLLLLMHPVWYLARAIVFRWRA